jgi:hypothetical protein
MKKTFAIKLGATAAIFFASIVFAFPLPTIAADATCVCKDGTAGSGADAASCDASCGSSHGGGGTLGTAATPTPGGTPTAGSLTNPLSGACTGIDDKLPDAGQKCVQLIIGNVIKAALGIVGSIALLMMTYGGYRWLTAMGNSEKVEKGKDTLIWAALGLVVIFGAYAITSYIISKLTAGK